MVLVLFVMVMVVLVVFIVVCDDVGGDDSGVGGVGSDDSGVGESDLIILDITCYLNGYHGYCSEMFTVGEINPTYDCWVKYIHALTTTLIILLFHNTNTIITTNITTL